MNEAIKFNTKFGVHIFFWICFKLNCAIFFKVIDICWQKCWITDMLLLNLKYYYKVMLYIRNEYIFFNTTLIFALIHRHTMTQHFITFSRYPPGIRTYVRLYVILIDNHQIILVINLIIFVCFLLLLFIRPRVSHATICR